jgi:hypothetical protein
VPLQELEKLATTFLDSEDVLITKLNGEAFPEYSYRFGVRGFPTIFWFPAGAEKPTQECVPPITISLHDTQLCPVSLLRPGQDLTTSSASLSAATTIVQILGRPACIGAHELDPWKAGGAEPLQGPCCAVRCGAVRCGAVRCCAVLSIARAAQRVTADDLPAATTGS